MGFWCVPAAPSPVPGLAAHETQIIGSWDELASEGTGPAAAQPRGAGQCTDRVTDTSRHCSHPKCLPMTRATPLPPAWGSLKPPLRAAPTTGTPKAAFPNPCEGAQPQSPTQNQPGDRGQAWLWVLPPSRFCRQQNLEQQRPVSAALKPWLLAMALGRQPQGMVLGQVPAPRACPQPFPGRRWAGDTPWPQAPQVP